LECWIILFNFIKRKKIELHTNKTQNLRPPSRHFPAYALAQRLTQEPLVVSKFLAANEFQILALNYDALGRPKPRSINGSANTTTATPFPRPPVRPPALIPEAISLAPAKALRGGDGARKPKP